MPRISPLINLPEVNRRIPRSGMRQHQGKSDVTSLRKSIGARAAVSILAVSVSAGPSSSDETCSRQAISFQTDKGFATFSTEIADTEEERQIGLMFRPYLPIEHAMLFVWPEAKPRAFWMKNTHVALDMLFLDGDGRICSIAQSAVPQSEELIRSSCDAQFVLEISAGLSERLGISTGTLVHHALLPICAGGD